MNTRFYFNGALAIFFFDLNTFVFSNSNGWKKKKVYGHESKEQFLKCGQGFYDRTDSFVHYSCSCICIAYYV